MSNLVKSFVQWGSQQKSQDNLCETCGKKPKFVENGFQHPYCGRTCARKSQAQRPSTCALRGCHAPPKPGNTGFCSDAHGRDAVRLGQAKACSQCRVHPQGVGELCAACGSRAQTAPRLRELDNNGPTFRSLVTYFSRQWSSPDTTAKIEKILEVALPNNLQMRHQAYANKLNQMSGAREYHTYHSAQCICDLGTKDASLCEWKSCGTCNIVKSAFHAFAFGEDSNSGSYGKGIYTYHNPAMADKHAVSTTTSPFRVMIACDIVVAGARTPGGSNAIVDDERVFVSNADAAVPTYILLYTKS